MTPSESADPALAAYQALAADYDDLTAGLDYEPWLAEVLPRLEGWGLAKGRLLDVGCGTGESLIPMLERGWRCSGCDISAAMIEVARGKIGGEAELHVADMRSLPHFGNFDLVWSLNDSINYLLDRRQLESALRSMRGNMMETGLLVFDLNTILTYRTYFAERRVVERAGRPSIIWDGRAGGDQAVGSVATARIEVAGESDTAHLHEQRHIPESGVLKALEQAGLECLAVFGQDDGGGLHEPLRELSHVKALYVARRRSALYGETRGFAETSRKLDPGAQSRRPGRPTAASTGSRRSGVAAGESFPSGG